MEHNPYSAPQSDLHLTQSGKETPPLWNPNAAALWSLLFSPVFGAILHMKNWEALGNMEQAKASKTWAIMSAVVFIGATIWGMLAPEGGAADRASSIVGIALLLGWYMTSGREQVKLVKGFASYPRRGWGKPILLGIGALIALIVLSTIVFIVSELASGGMAGG